jgi:8-oxo-dGTP diphosphatase
MPAGDADAAGGIVCRPGRGAVSEVAIIHRPSRNDWSLPKGKLDAGEPAWAAALREVEEETGLRCEIVRPAGRAEYTDRQGQRRIVAYWIMRPTGGDFRANDEVDALRWLTVDEALGLLTYDSDRRLLASLDLAENQLTA